MKILILGASGLVGSFLLKQALNHPHISMVVAPSRKPLPLHPKLVCPLVSFESLPPTEDWWHVDAIICALGTTIKKAQSKDAFYRVDHDYPLLAAQMGQNNGVKTFVLNSAAGANLDSPIFYNKVKGEVENDLIKMNFHSLTIARPGLIGGDRKESRPGEYFAKCITKALQPILPKKFHLNEPKIIAAKMLEAALLAKPGVHILSSESFV